ncbi:MAG: NERD domain-containing protein [Clostridia bacterium]|nr:NERD domain-containing protein [Clostridia bacterium]
MSEFIRSPLFFTLCLLLAVILSAAVTLFITITVKSKKRVREIENYGKPSEQRLKEILEEAFSPSAVFTNVYIPYVNSGKDRYAEIDAIVVNRSGIFVIELKSHNGKIISGDTRKWTQIYNDKRISFYNPIYQNETHIKVINEILKSEGQYRVPIYNVVTFSSNRVTFTQSYRNLVKLDELVRYIKRTGKPEAVSIRQTSRVRTILHSYIRTGRTVELKHKRFVRKRK